MKWLLLLLWDPVAALDLDDAEGRVDHGKMIGWVMAWAILATLLATGGKIPSLGHTITLLAAAQGTRTFIAFLKSKTVTVEGTMQEGLAPEHGGKSDEDDADALLR